MKTIGSNPGSLTLEPLFFFFFPIILNYGLEPRERTLNTREEDEDDNQTL